MFIFSDWRYNPREWEKAEQCMELLPGAPKVSALGEVETVAAARRGHAYSGLYNHYSKVAVDQKTRERDI